MATPRKFAVGIDLQNSPLLRALMNPCTAHPPGRQDGSLWYRNDLGQFFGRENGVDKSFAFDGSGMTGPGSSNDGQIAVFDGSTGQALKVANVTGLLKATSGVLQQAVAGTDFSVPAGTETLTNKTINAANNSISNIGLGSWAAGIVSTTVNASSTDAQIPTGKAVWDAILGKVASLMQETQPLALPSNYPASTKNQTYRITTPGKIGGASGPTLRSGQIVMCIADSGAGTHAAVGANFLTVESDYELATIATAGVITLADATAANWDDAVSAITPAWVKTQKVPRTQTFTIGNASATSFVVSHNNFTHHGAAYSVIQLTEVATGDVIEAAVNIAADNATIEFDVAPASNSIRVTVVG